MVRKHFQSYLRRLLTKAAVVRVETVHLLARKQRSPSKVSTWNLAIQWPSSRDLYVCLISYLQRNWPPLTCSRPHRQAHFGNQTGWGKDSLQGFAGDRRRPARSLTKIHPPKLSANTGSSIYGCACLEPLLVTNTRTAFWADVGALRAIILPTGHKQRRIKDAICWCKGADEKYGRGRESHWNWICRWSGRHTEEAWRRMRESIGQP